MMREKIHDINRRLRHLLELIPQQETGQLRVTADDLTVLLTEMRKVEQYRTQVDTGQDLLALEFEEYRKNLEGLRDMLPRLQARYLAERARLEHERVHLQAASGWAQIQAVFERR